MTRKSEISPETLERLRTWLPKGATAYTILDHVSRSGMSRRIRVVVPLIDGTYRQSIHPQSRKMTDYVERQSIRIDFIHPNHAIAEVLGRRVKDDAIICHGAGMDMGFELVYALSLKLYGDGYALNHRWL